MSLIIGTAGHIDHGKTALIKELNGFEGDNLEEEKKRGITIDLSFSNLSKNDENKPTNDLINDVSLSEPSLQSSNKTTFELNTTEVNDEATTLDENITIIKSPLVGTYYSSSKPGGDSYVTVGSNVKKGDVLCIIEAMKIMNEITSEVDGKIIEVLREDEDIVEFGMELFKII